MKPDAIIAAPAFAGAQAKGLLPASDDAAEPMVNCLLAHVCLQSGYAVRRHREDAVAALPANHCAARTSATSAGALDLLRQRGDREGRGDRASHVYVVLDTANHGPRAAQPSRLLAEHRPELLLHFRCDHGLTVPRRPDEVDVQLLPTVVHLFHYTPPVSLSCPRRRAQQ